MVSNRIRNAAPGNRLWVRVPCPPLLFWHSPESASGRIRHLFPALDVVSCHRPSLRRHLVSGRVPGKSDPKKDEPTDAEPQKRQNKSSKRVGLVAIGSLLPQSEREQREA